MTTYMNGAIEHDDVVEIAENIINGNLTAAGELLVAGHNVAVNCALAILVADELANGDGSPRDGEWDRATERVIRILERQARRG